MKNLIVILMLVVLTAGFVFAQDTTPAPPPTTDVEQIAILKHFLEGEKKHLDFVYNTMRWTYGIGIGLFTLIAGLLVYFNITSAKSIRTKVEGNLEAGLEEKLERKLSDLDRTRLQPIRKHVKFLSAYRESKIHVYGQAAYKDDLMTQINDMLVDRMDMEHVNSKNSVTEGSVLASDIVVFCHPGHPGEREAVAQAPANAELKNLTQLIKGKNIPLVIYSQNGNRLSSEENQLVHGNIWYTYANMPLSLVTTLYSVSRTFYR